MFPTLILATERWCVAGGWCLRARSWRSCPVTAGAAGAARAQESRGRKEIAECGCGSRRTGACREGTSAAINGRRKRRAWKTSAYIECPIANSRWRHPALSLHRSGVNWRKRRQDVLVLFRRGFCDTGRQKPGFLRFRQIRNESKNGGERRGGAIQSTSQTRSDASISFQVN